MLVLNDTFFDIAYDEGYILDAEHLLDDAQYAKNLVCDFYEYKYDKKIRIMNFNNPVTAKEHGINLDWEFMRSNWEKTKFIV